MYENSIQILSLLCLREVPLLSTVSHIHIYAHILLSLFTELYVCSGTMPLNSLCKLKKRAHATCCSPNNRRSSVFFLGPVRPALKSRKCQKVSRVMNLTSVLPHFWRLNQKYRRRISLWWKRKLAVLFPQLYWSLKPNPVPCHLCYSSCCCAALWNSSCLIFLVACARTLLLWTLVQFLPGENRFLK